MRRRSADWSLAALIERIDVGTNRIDIHIRPTGLGALLDVAAALLPNATDAETQTLISRPQRRSFTGTDRGRRGPDSANRCRPIS
jgi:hypothetical protein